jgi:PAS domain S-box-containing protein
MIFKKDIFYALIQNSSDIISILGTDGTIRYESPSIERLLGYTPDELTGRSAFEIIHPDDLQTVMGAFNEVMMNPAFPLSAEFRVNHKDGSWRVIEATGSNQISNPLIGGIVVNSRDVTERRKAEALLREATKQAEEERAKSEAIISAIGYGISVQDTDFRILFMNRTARDMFGDCVGEYCYRVYERRDHVCEQCPLAMSFADGGIHREERSNPTRPLHVEITASPIRDAGGRIIAGVEAVRDITEQKRMEEKLRESLASVKTLRGLIPMCAWCKKIREDSGYWKKVETYIQEHSDASFTHGICPECLKKQDPGTYEKVFGNEDEYRDPKSDKRNSERTRLAKPLACVITVSAGDSEKARLNAAIENMSDAGMCVRTDRPLERGCIVVLSDGKGDRTGIVRWRRKDNGDPGTYRVGIQFVRELNRTLKFFKGPERTSQ